MTEPFIRFEGVSKSFAAPRSQGRRSVVQALRKVDLEIARGSVWGVVGPNGAGKSTLFGLLLGFLKPSDGDVAIDSLHPRDYLRSHGASYMPERFRLAEDWTPAATLHALLNLEKASDVDEKVSGAIVQFGLERYADKQVHTLSRGTLQRVGLAQAFAVRHDLIVLDEPTEGLDPIWRVRLREMIKGAVDAGSTILIASHDIREVERVTDHVLVLENGAIKDIVEARSDAAGATRYVIRTDADRATIERAFASATSTDRAWIVDVADATDLTMRLAALIDSGATIHAVNPANDLEQRVHDRLGLE